MFDFIKKLLAPKPPVNSTPYIPGVTATAPKAPVSPVMQTNGGQAPTPLLSPGGYSTLTAKGGSVPSPFSAPVSPQVKSPLSGYSMVPTRTDPTQMKLQAPTTSKPAVPSTSYSAPTGTMKPVSPIIPTSSSPAGQTPQEMAVTGANGTPTNQNIPTPPMPTDPQQNAAATGALSLAEKAYQDSLKISPDELSTQEDLDKLLEATKNSYAKISDQPIMLDFITGQMASVERRALNLAEPLERKMARLQAARTSSMEASKFALERADKAAEASKPIAVSAGQSLYDPKTGKTVFTAPKEAEGFTLSEGQVRYDAKGNPITGIGTGTGTGNAAVDSWVSLINSGRAKLSDVPNSLLNQVATGLKSAPAGQDPKATYALTQAGTALTSIDTALGLLSDPNAMNMAETAFGRAVGGVVPGSSVANLNAALDTVKALVGFDALQKMRESSPTGGALGQITERELAFLQSVQGSLNTMQGTEQLKATINRVKQSFETLKIVNSPDGTEFPLDGQIYVKQGDQFVPKGFNQVGGDTQQASRPVRNNNPLNIKASTATSTYSGVAGIDPKPADDGGQFLVFNSPEAGFDAAKRLIQTEGYKDLTVDAALKRWSANGYGGEIVPELRGRTVAQLTSTELESLIQAMARKEGYYA